MNDPTLREDVIVRWGYIVTVPAVCAMIVVLFIRTRLLDTINDATALTAEATRPDIEYLYDVRTKLCFAINHGPVPCTDEVMKLARRAGR